MRPFFAHLMASSALNSGPQYTVTTVATQSFLAANTTSQACDISAMGAQTGDIVVIAAVCGNVTSDQSFSASGNQSGAAASLADVYSDDLNDTNLYVGLLKVGATPDTTITVNYSSQNRYVIMIKILRNVHQAVQLDVAVVTASNANSSRPNPGSITPVTPGAMIITVYGASRTDTSGAAWTVPSDVNNFIQYNDTNRPNLAMGEKSWLSGAFDPTNLTGAPSSTDDSWAAVTLALRPGSPPGAQEYGSELITNGTFNTNTTGWTMQGTGTMALVSNALKVTQTNATPTAATQVINTVAGKGYRVVYDAVTGTAAPQVKAVGGTTLGSGNAGIGQSFTFVADGATTTIQLFVPGAGNATFDNISVKEVL